MVERLKVGDRVWALHPALVPLGGERGFAKPCSRTRITGREPRRARPTRRYCRCSATRTGPRTPMIWSAHPDRLKPVATALGDDHTSNQRERSSSLDV